MSEQTPEMRARAAAEGASVTSRAVRERSGVKMVVAADAARVWNEETARATAVPDLPQAVQLRLEGIWAEAFTAARLEFDDARAGWTSRIQHLEDEVRDLTSAVSDAEQATERAEAAAAKAADRAAIELAVAQRAATERIQDATDLLADTASRADGAEGALGAVTAERDRLLTEITTLRGEIQATRKDAKQK